MLFQKLPKIQKKIVNTTSLIKKIALKTIRIESETLIGLSESINDAFCEATLAIFKGKGRVILSGVGKSAIIAQKITATLNSTGTAAIFMHAADAVHGDLGMIQGEDIIIFISKSGDTAEVKLLLQLLDGTGNLLIGICANKDSFLAKQSDFLLYTPVPEEADPNNLAPTASTTAQLVMGDALATALLALRGFSPQDFAQFHPGGILGKQLYLRVKNIFPQNEKPRVSPDDSLQTIIIEMTSKRLGVAVVCDAADLVKGVITDGDLRRMLKKSTDIVGVKARDIMSVAPKLIEMDALAVKALNIMKANSISQLVVVDKMKYMGVIHIHDLIREGLI